MAVTTRLIDLSTLLRGLGRDFNPKALDLREPLKACSVYLFAQGKRRFQTSTSPSGERWAPLRSPRRRRRDRRARGGSGQKPLWDSGVLMASMSSGPSLGALVEITRLSLEQGTNIFYGQFHQFGTRHMVMRQFVGINNNDVQKIEMIIGDYLLKQMASRIK